MPTLAELIVRLQGDASGLNDVIDDGKARLASYRAAAVAAATVSLRPRGGALAAADLERLRALAGELTDQLRALQAVGLLRGGGDEETATATRAVTDYQKAAEAAAGTDLRPEGGADAATELDRLRRLAAALAEQLRAAQAVGLPKGPAGPTSGRAAEDYQKAAGAAGKGSVRPPGAAAAAEDFERLTELAEDLAEQLKALQAIGLPQGGTPGAGPARAAEDYQKAAGAAGKTSVRPQGATAAAEDLDQLRKLADALTARFQVVADTAAGASARAPVKPSPVVDQARQQVGNYQKAADQAGKTDIKPKGGDEAESMFRKLHQAAAGLAQQLLGLSGINLGSILGLGTIAGVLAVVGKSVQSFMGREDEMRGIENRFKMLGMEAKSNTQALWDFGRAVSDVTTMSRGDVRDLAASALQRGLDPSRYQEMTRAAIGFGEAVGIGPQRALHLMEQLEAGNTRVLSRVHPIFRQMIQMGASRAEIESKVNEFIASGNQLALERKDTYAGKLGEAKKAIGNLGKAFAGVVGPALTPTIMKIADAAANAANKMAEWIKANKEAAIQATKAITSTLLLTFAFRHAGGAVSLLGGALKKLVPGLGAVSSAAGSGGGLLGGLLHPLRALTGLGGNTTLTGWLSTLLGGFLSLGGAGGKMKGLFTSLGPLFKGGFSATLGAINGVLGKSVGVILDLINPVKGAAKAVNLFKFALSGLFKLSGIGLIIGLVAAIAGVEDTFGNTQSGLEGLGGSIQQVFQQVQAFLAPIWQWLRVEGMIVVRALAAAFKQFVDIAKGLWEGLRQSINTVLQWIASAFGGTATHITSLWAEFTANLAVLGLHVKRAGMIMLLGFIATWRGVVYLWDGLKSFGSWMGEFGSYIGSVFSYLVEKVAAVGAAIGAFLENPTRGFHIDTTRAEAALDRVRASYARVAEGMRAPEYDIGDAGRNLQARIGAVSQEITLGRDAARAAQDAERRRGVDHRTTEQRRTGGLTGGNVRVGGQDKASFSAPAAFWKKLQEAAASQRVEEVQRQQLTQQQEMVRILTAMHQQMGQAPGIVPPGAVIPQ